MRMSFAVLDRVRITRLLFASRDVDGPSAEPPQPRIGQCATVVDIVGDGVYLAEHATDDGYSLWLAEFHEQELELLERAEAS